MSLKELRSKMIIMTYTSRNKVGYDGNVDVTLSREDDRFSGSQVG